ncbi:hypothetical protein V6N11_076907 [Hibiscus sabdariffa]|uniref:Uncharacterized protein n=1 Tax=Hibiscus sabdariffa TaxID=183260 RepID=A0ABR2TC36_9ROSI
MPNDWHNLLEVPGNRLSETGSRQINFCILEDSCQEWSTRQNKEAVVSWQSKVVLKQLGSAYQKEGRKLVKVKDLKPKRIKGYLEYKFSQRSPALLKYLLFNDF